MFSSMYLFLYWHHTLLGYSNWDFWPVLCIVEQRLYCLEIEMFLSICNVYTCLVAKRCANMCWSACLNCKVRTPNWTRILKLSSHHGFIQAFDIFSIAIFEGLPYDSKHQFGFVDPLCWPWHLRAWLNVMDDDPNYCPFPPVQFLGPYLLDGRDPLIHVCC